MNKILIIILGLLTMSFHCVAQDDVDTKIAVNDNIDPNTFVIIIANENYKYEQPVPYAKNDGETFRLYCEKTLGIPKKNIRFCSDATLNDMRMQIQWLLKIMNACDGDARAIFYYSGHGMPSEDGKHSFLLPIDGISTVDGSGVSIADLYRQLGQMLSRQTLVILDACFSGARRDGQMLSFSRGVAIKSKQEEVNGNLVVFSASQGNETAYPYEEKRHGLFTFYLLEQLQQKGGCVTLGELSDYVTKKVKRMSILENNKEQTPSVIASPTNKEWRNWLIATKIARKYETIEGNTNSTLGDDKLSIPHQSPVTNENSVKSLSISESSFLSDVLGVTLRPITESQKKQLDISYGLEIIKVKKEGKMKEAGIPKGYIIQKVNDVPMRNSSDLEEVAKNANKTKVTMMIKGIYPTGKKGSYVVYIN